MKFTYDHDLHIHSHISACSNDPEQNNDTQVENEIEALLKGE